MMQLLRGHFEVEKSLVLQEALKRWAEEVTHSGGPESPGEEVVCHTCRYP